MDELICLAQLFHHTENGGLRIDGADLDCLSAHVMSTEASTHVVAHHARPTHRHHTFTGSLPSEVVLSEHALLADTVGNEHLEQVVCHLIELINLLDMSSDNGLLFLEDADSSVDFHVHFVSKRSINIEVTY